MDPFIDTKRNDEEVHLGVVVVVDFVRLIQEPHSLHAASLGHLHRLQETIVEMEHEASIEYCP